MKKRPTKTIKEVCLEHDNNYSSLEEKFYEVTNSSLCYDPYDPPTIHSAHPLTVSVVIPAYNVQSSILSCLISIEQSSFNKNLQNRLQVIVVDDGSQDNTWNVIKKTNLSLHLVAVKQRNYGQAQALNTGISIAEGDIIISCDADMVLSYYAIEQIVMRHELLPNALFTGFRCDTHANDPRVNPAFMQKHGVHRDSCFTNDERIMLPAAGYPENMCLASNHYKRLGYYRRLWMPDDKTLKDPWLLSDLVFGALFSLSRKIFQEVGGYDERLIGWGCTDGLLAAKAISHNQFIIPLYSASGLHIHHQFRTTDKQTEYAENRKNFMKIIQTETINGHPDYVTNAKIRIIETVIKDPKKNDINSYEPKIPENQKKSLNCIDSLLAIGKYHGAMDILSHSIINNKIERSLRLGKIFFGQKRYDEAIQVFTEIPITTKFTSEISVPLARAYAANGKFDAAQRMLKHFSTSAMHIDKYAWYHWSTDAYIRQGEKFYFQKFYDVAIACFEAALCRDPKNKIAQNYRDSSISKLKLQILE